MSKLISKEKLMINYFYSLSYMFMGIAMFQVVSYSTKSYPYYWYFSYYMIPLAICSPLLLYLRFRFLIQGKLMRIPLPIMIFLIIIPLFILAGPIAGSKINFVRENIELRPLLDDTFMKLPFYFMAVHAINFIAKIVLSTGLLLLIIRTRFLWRKKNTENMMLANISYIFTILMFSTSVIMIIGDLVSFEFSKAAIAMVNSVTLGVFFASQYDPSYYAIFKHMRQKKKYAVSKVLNLDVDSVIDRLNRLMIENHLYMEEDLSIKAVAGMLDVNHQQLSEIINKKLKRSFSCYVNDFKISEAKKILLNEPGLTITRIALMTGFNSVRTFNRVFAKSTGLNPVEYRKNTKVR
jgi:AraC-like DNA-binding protein